VRFSRAADQPRRIKKPLLQRVVNRINSDACLNNAWPGISLGFFFFFDGIPFLAAAAVSSTYGGCSTECGSLFGTPSGGFTDCDRK
jgi:hypothetical protein